MPGIVGHIYRDSVGLTEIQAARQLMKYHDWYQDSEIWSHDGFACTHTATAVIDRERYPRSFGDIYIWIDGETYNFKATAERQGLIADNLEELLSNAWKSQLLEPTLAVLDGVFSAVMYDKKKQEILFITDRYGSKPFYLWQKGQYLAWSSEVKSFFAFRHFEKQINPVAITALLQIGHLPGDQTWFKAVKRLPAASIVHYAILKKSIISETRYWKWGNLNLPKISFREAVEHTALLVQKAIKKTCREDIRTGLLLSGGIDSRMILAAIPDTFKLGCFTFGDEQSDDVRIAAQVAAKAGRKHRIIPISKENWWTSRAIGAWQTDGMVNAFHLHNTAQQGIMKGYCDLYLNGHSINLGGYLIKYPNQRVDAAYVKGYFGELAPLTAWDDSYFDINRQGPFYFDAVIQHKSIYGGVNFTKTVEMRRPFIDNDLLDFVYTLPDQYRMNYRLYLSVVLQLSPELFGEIPWQKTGFSVRNQWLTRWYLKLRIKEIRRRMGLQQQSFPIADYANWIREPDASNYFSNLLDPAKAIYTDYINADFRKQYWIPHLTNRGNYIEQIGRAATIEWWLNSIFR